MSDSDRMVRWSPFIKEAARRFRVPETWIRAIVMIESGGRTMLGENRPMTSSAGAMGLMQVMPQTWAQMRHTYRLGADPYDPRDNILAGTAYLQLLFRQYGYPALFAAYNDGPGMLEAHRRMRQFMPTETTAYVLDIARILSTGVRRNPRLAIGAPGSESNGSPVQAAAGAVIVIPSTPQREPGENNDSDEVEEH